MLGAAALMAASSSLAAAQAAKLPPVRPLGAVERTSTELLGAVSTTRALSDGRVLVNDIIGRRVLMFDPTLASFTVVADTTSATGNAFSSRFGGLMAYKGDSSLFIDPTSLSMLVIDAKGAIGRVMSIPRPNDAQALIGGPNGNPGFDAQGRLVYRAPPQFRFNGGPPGQGGQRPAGNAMVMPEFPDTQAVIRVELATRKVDTVGFLKVPRPRMNVTQDSAGRMQVSPVINPLPATDDWAILADGSIAFLRGIDYHVDWVRADGSRESSGKLPFQWRHLSDSEKVAFIDSAKTAMEKVRAAAVARMGNNTAGGPPPPMVMGEAMAGAQVMVFRNGGGPPGSTDQPRGRNEAGGPMNFTLPPITMVPPNELPDYAPPFTQGAARADMDGHVWIRTTNTVNGGAVYDVVDAKGELVDRVAMPAGRVIAGFGPRGAVYMGVRDGTGVRLEQARRTAVAMP
jgi:hypothetical protein